MQEGIWPRFPGPVRGAGEEGETRSGKYGCTALGRGSPSKQQELVLCFQERFSWELMEHPLTAPCQRG